MISHLHTIRMCVTPFFLVVLGVQSLTASSAERTPSELYPVRVHVLANPGGGDPGSIRAIAFDTVADLIAVARMHRTGLGSISLQRVENHSSARRLIPPLPTRLGPVRSLGFAAGALWAFDPGNRRILAFPSEANESPKQYPISGELSSSAIGFSGVDVRQVNDSVIAFTAVERTPDSSPSGFSVTLMHVHLAGEASRIASVPLGEVEMLQFVSATGVRDRIALPLSAPTVWNISPSGEALWVVHSHAPSTVSVVPNSEEVRGNEAWVPLVADPPRPEAAMAEEWLHGGLDFKDAPVTVRQSSDLGTWSGVSRIIPKSESGMFLVQRTRWSQRVWIDAVCGGDVLGRFELVPTAGTPSPHRFSFIGHGLRVFLSTETESGEQFLEEFHLPSALLSEATEHCRESWEQN